MKTTSKIITYILLATGAIVMLFPFFWMITGSLKTYNEITASPIVWWPKVVQWSNYARALEIAPFDKYFVNTVLVATINTVIVLLTSIFCCICFFKIEIQGQRYHFLNSSGNAYDSKSDINNNELCNSCSSNASYGYNAGADYTIYSEYFLYISAKGVL